MNNKTSLNPPHSAASRRSALWRIHFWAALIASPFLLVAASTGILYIFTPQIEAIRYGALERVIPGDARHRLDESVAAARATIAPGWQVQSVGPPQAPGDAVRVTFGQRKGAAGGHDGHQNAETESGTRTVYVNPYTGAVMGSMNDAERFGNWSKKLHSRLLQGDGWRWVIELAASAMMVMLLTGIALWWPGKGRGGVPRAGVKGRAAWKQWHSFMGVALGAVSFTILATGLTWSHYAGSQIRAARDALGQAPAPLPHLMVAPREAAELDWEGAWMAARRLAPRVAMRITAPHGPGATWRVTAADPGRPASRFDLLLDPYSGAPLYYADWSQQTAFGKATAIGIPFHRGEFGWWNQALLLMFGLGVLFSLVSGWTMYLRRRQGGAGWLPRLLPGAWRGAAPLALPAVLLCALMPVLAVASAAVLVLELALARNAPAPGR